MNLRALAANTAWLAASLPAYRRYTQALADPARAQGAWLQAHLRRNGDTAYGRALRLPKVASYAEFARRVPIVDYEAVQPWVKRIRDGDSAVLTREPVIRLVPTSGSTSARKLIPFTRTLQREFSTAVAAWIVDLFREQPGIAGGPAYWSVTPWAEQAVKEHSAVPIGFADDSEYLGGLRARLVEAVMAVPASVRHLDDLVVFRRTVLLHLLRRRDLRLISVWHPSFLSLLLDTLRREWSTLLPDLGHEFSERTRELAATDPADIAAIWPELRVVSCWGDANAQGGAAELQARLGAIGVQAKGLLATEACVTVPFQGQHPLALGAHFFEFIDEDGRVRTPETLRPGESYEVVVTTGGGLWRYRLGDRVQVNGFVGRTPSVRFIGRSGNVTDFCGEKLSDAFVAQVLDTLCPRARFALLAPEVGRPALRYALFIETEAVPPPEPRQLDTALAANPHYAVCRRLGQLEPPRVVRIATAAYARYAAAETARGLRLGDIKPVALSPRTDWAEKLCADGGNPSANFDADAQPVQVARQ